MTKVHPNFWTSKDYLHYSETPWIEKDGLSGWWDETEWLIPPLDNFGCFVTAGVNVYAGWPQMHNEDTDKFVDHQFVYNPQDFLKMEGHSWQTFRKNVRKFPRRNSGDLQYRRFDNEEGLEKLLVLWAQGRTIFDPDTMVRTIMRSPNRKGLFLNDCLIGVNVWDENWMYVNYRYCIDDSSGFLNEYLRWRFYTDEEILNKTKLVNDGGSLDSDTLYRFKMKLNPVTVWKVYSIRSINNG